MIPICNVADFFFVGSTLKPCSTDVPPTQATFDTRDLAMLAFSNARFWSASGESGFDWFHHDDRGIQYSAK